MSTNTKNATHESRVSLSSRNAEDETEPLQSAKDNSHSRPKYHKQAIYLLLLYVPLIIVPWVLTCIISRRPLGASGYYEQHGFRDSEIDRMDKWVTAINVLNSITSLITIPVLSALIAQAAAVYSQRDDSRQNLHLKHLIALADRGWTNPFILGKTWMWEGHDSNSVRGLLHFAAGLIIIGSIQQPLYQILAPMESVLIPTCQDTSYMRNAPWHDLGVVVKDCVRKSVTYKDVGWDIEPGEYSELLVKDMSQKLIGDLADVSFGDPRPHLWNNASDRDAGTQLLEKVTNNTFFVAAVPQGTTTGVLREHVMRFNSSVSCNRIPRSQYPSACEGYHPFTRSFAHGNNVTRVCVPGALSTSPWSLSRDRQEISEDLFLDILEEAQVEEEPGYPRSGNWTSDFTLHCTTHTTRGYFELGNYRNNYTWGPLLDTWPDAKTMEKEFNDYSSDHGLNWYPSRIDTGRFRGNMSKSAPNTWRLPGPLTMATISLFGNKTFFDLGVQAWNSTFDKSIADIIPYDRICGLVPFSRLDPDNESFDSGRPPHEHFPKCKMFDYQVYGPKTLRENFSAWLHGFNDTEQATRALSLAVYLVHEAALTVDTWQIKYRRTQWFGGAMAAQGGRVIYSGSGATIQKPKLPLVSIIIISCIVSLELLGLAILAWLTYRGPSETRSLDVMTFTKLKDGLEEDEKGNPEDDSRTGMKGKVAWSMDDHPKVINRRTL